ncbi:tetratricopeptide repeat protein [Shewanella sp. CG12_big_fil_rev_8_21_14_0_65_47_15]|uniref:tetratricopeptide repeat protein n=1 Tax=Shewanella sp. CG12_big_fil_rev_8_21_14_0_65_47_15 TaxID=1975537 RepID=UPI000CBCEE10|nr:tetratricopeptide repeat protein [Shewanella sp. CG12_big_fil_rev_8_21_14_0_65_47_15]PIW59987.1 MAG: MSHA biogenesis protein MshN [Shewanella sp. CG12_big_fil_rev_8_21_14_0_65_47_15]
MSVINKMLQDLDKRQQGHQLSNITSPQMQYMGRVGHSKKSWLIGVVCLLLGALSVYAFQGINKQDNVVSQPQPQLEQQPQLQASQAQASQPIATTELASSVTVPAVDAVVHAVDIALPVDDPVAQVPVTGVALGPETEIETEPHPQSVAEHKLTPTPEPIAEPVQAAGKMAVTEVKLTPTQLAQKQLIMAIDADKRADWSKAIEHYNKALNLDPSLHEARKQLAALYYGQGQLPDAAQVLQQGWLLYPQEFEFTLLLARVQQAMGDTESALTSLANIPDSHVLARQKWLAQSDLAQKQGQFTLAEQAYRQLLQLEPQQGKWWMGLGYALDSQQQFAQASQAYRSALSHPGLSMQATAFIEQRLNQLGDSQ